MLGQLLPDWAQGHRALWAFMLPTVCVLASLILVRGMVLRFNLKVDVPAHATTALYLVGALFVLTWPRHDTWLWLTALPMYVMNVAALAAAFGLILNPRVKSVVGHLIVFVLGLFAGGASEPMALAALIVCIYLLMDGQTTARPTKLHALTLGLFIGFGLMLMAPGNWMRKAAQPNLATWPMVVVAAKTYLKSILIELPLRLPIAAVLAAPFALLGRNNATVQCHGLPGLIATQTRFLAMADGLLMVNAAAMAWALGTSGPARVWVVIPLLSLIFAISAVFRWAEWLGQRHGKWVPITVVAFQISLTAALLFLWATQVPVAAHYAKAYELRMGRIDEMLQKDSIRTTIVLEPLPESGWLMSAEISTDTAHFSNRQLSAYFGNKVKFVKK